MRLQALSIRDVLMLSMQIEDPWRYWRDNDSGSGRFTEERTVYREMK